jgi:hypothetical protein
MGMLWYTISVIAIWELVLIATGLFTLHMRTFRESGNRVAYLLLWIAWDIAIVLLVSGQLFVLGDWLTGGNKS